MFATFFHELKQAGRCAISRPDGGDLEAPRPWRIEKFYYLSRSALVKDERNLDRLDRVFGHVIRRRSPRAPLPINCAACMA
jgi:uncharacterized protein with von Willebrand factor type A (vWA) domain